MLATAGVTVGHVLGYAIAHRDSAAREVALGGHGYLPGVAALVVPVGLVAALWWAVCTARALGLAGRIDPRRLAAAQVGLFAVQEVGERVVVGEGLDAVLSEPGVWMGFVAQVAVAHVVVAALEWVRRAVREMILGRRPRVRLGLRPRLLLAPDRAPATVPATVSVGLRAPPVGR